MDFDPISAVMVWICFFGLPGLFAVAVAERFVPILPSYGLLLTVGIAAQEGAWSLAGALVTTSAGGLVGCAACFHAVRALGEARSRRLVFRAGRLFGMSRERTARQIAAFRRNQLVLAFSLQLLPTIRLFAPAFAGLLRGPSRGFLIASAAGIAVWNGVFVTAGYAAAHSIDTVNATVLALGVLGGVLALEAVLIGVGRALRTRRGRDVALRRC